MTKKKKPDTFDLFNDESLWGNQETEDLTHEDIMETNWNRKHTQAYKESLRRRMIERYQNGYVNPNLGRKYDEEHSKRQSEALSGVAKPLEGNKKLSKLYKGKPKNPKQVAKIAKKMQGRTHNRGRRVMTPKGEFDKITLAAKAYGVTDMAIKNKITNPNHPGFYFLDDINSLGAKKVQTPDGVFNSTKEAATHYKISDNGMRTRCHNDKWPDFYFLDERSNFESSQVEKPLT